MQADWFLTSAFAQTDLTRVAYNLLKGDLWLPGFGKRGIVTLCTLGELASLGPDGRDIHDGFDVGDSVTSYPALWGHDTQAVNTLGQEHNKYLSPLSKAKPGRPLRKLEDLWPKSSRILIGARIRLNTGRVTAVRLAQPALSNVWWPVVIKTEIMNEQHEKALALWLNSTLGLCLVLTKRQETEGAWVQFKKPIWTAMPVLDVRALSAEQLAALADAYDRICDKPLQPFPRMADDEVRAEMDAAIAAALGLPDYGVLRTMLAREPVVSMQRLG